MFISIHCIVPELLTGLSLVIICEICIAINPGVTVYRLDFKLEWHNMMRKRTFVLKQVDGAAAPSRTPTWEDTSSGEVFNLALMWMGECDCVKDADPQQDGLDRWRPTRLLDLSDLKTEAYHQEIYTNKNISESRGANLYTGKPKHPDDAEVRLVDTKSATYENKSHYVTLSHRWGDNKGMQQVMLKQKNLEDSQRGLKLKDLPEHFRDAIEFAATLHNVQYIWIDSICIIQDSTEDWLIESSLMHQVYSQSYLNISTTAAEQSRQWLYLRRKAKLPREAEANLYIKGLPGSRTEKDRVEQRRRYEVGMQPRVEDEAHKYIRRCTIIDASHFEDLVTQASVNRRAWVLQERLLAPRVLYFCQGQIAWECREHSAAGVLPRGMPTFQRRRNDDILEEIPLKGLEPLLHGRALREVRLRGMPEPDPHLLEVSSEIFRRTPLTLLTNTRLTPGL